jgi:hypothetical protein
LEYLGIDKIGIDDWTTIIQQAWETGRPRVPLLSISNWEYLDIDKIGFENLKTEIQVAFPSSLLHGCMFCMFSFPRPLIAAADIFSMF